ncbi:EscU/YscU/HrcU family type III secretion system export apparatus switch protein [Nocardioides sp. LHG3406-4]|uniref:EscU/YscU/HrcU family type III secretion system export apparatus switch protein n=1 Tax=Nocardioides sp. LHG3406-4 TaxID=2804575 RepID=UPI003CFA5CD5
MSEEKTEKPTDRKRKQSRKEGQVPRTQELGGWASMLLVGLALPPLMSREVGALTHLMTTALTATADVDRALALEILGQGLWHVLFTLVILGAAVMVVGVAATLSQGGFYLATKSMQPKLSKLSLLQGAKRIFGAQAAWEGVKMVIKSALVGVLVYMAIRSLMPLIGGMVPMSIVIDQFFGSALSLIRNIAVAGLVLAVADYAMARRRVGKQTRMSKQEVKQEHKNTEGDPLLKSAIRSRQLAAARNRMMSDVPTADVVLVNPTHVAIALQYDAERGAPRVVARGAGEVATKIRAKATEAGVPLVRDVPLARALYGSTKVGQEVPPELFNAVAQVLAFVISRRNSGRTGGEHNSPRAAGELPPVPRVRPRRPNPSGGSGSGR